MALVPPSTFVIFGGTGDLARRKILPAVYRLHASGVTALGCNVVATTRDSTLDDARYRELAREAIAEEIGPHDADEAGIDAWLERSVFFQPVGKGTAEEFTALGRRIEELERALSGPANRIFYVSLPPGAFPGTVRGLGDAALNRGPAAVRLVVEKPFGRDLDSARALNELVHRYFDESQIFRIDHYLGKEAVQNMLVFRFANAIFEKLWNRDHIESVWIDVAEELGVEQRAGYYDTAGALRDMVQSHLTQLVALVAMDVPSMIDASAIRTEKVKALRAITPVRADRAVFGQYGAGSIAGQQVPAYRAEPGVGPDSRTETYVSLTLELDNWRWQGVPFHLRTGKRLAQRVTQIEVRFRRAPVWMFRTAHTEAMERNSLILTLQPNEGFDLLFNIKAPGEPYSVRQLPLGFSYSAAFARLPEAYQTLLLDILRGDQTLFVHADEVETSWALYAPLLESPPDVRSYPAGSWGPGGEAPHLTERFHD